ncbi:MAG: aromatic ring-hydroxylating dioxygenase subunit alpha [Alphaproteobacteria bacterium]|nr:aromatic ring-hydroxylating dioxygenase subunit alpha [Alphaproteobacteria bacterium]
MLSQQLISECSDPALFRVDRRIYTDGAIFERELKQIFERGWVYLCHESQVADHGDYYATFMGRQPVFVIRQGDGGIGAFINACAHRGAVLTPRRRGRARTLVCRFHGWCYNTKGDCIRVKDEAEGWPDGIAKENYGLTPVARVGNYRGFIFGCLNADVADLEDSLGASRPFIDLLCDQSPDGLEVVPGQQTYLIRGNWKMQAENGVDGYHVSTVHRVFGQAMGKREAMGDNDGKRPTEAGRIKGDVPTGCYDLGQGHNMIWAGRANAKVAPLFEAEADLLTRFSQAKVDWMIRRGRNLYLFPNVQLMDQSSTQIRIFRPIAPDRTEVRVYCIAPKGESRSARVARLRKFEDFFMVTGMATPDDLAALEDCQIGAHGSQARWSDMERGITTMTKGPDELAKGIDANVQSSAARWDHETLYHGYFRHWATQMEAGQMGADE